MINETFANILLKDIHSRKPLHTSTLTISYLLTLFSKFFSRFPHGTCSLSVSCNYLGLDKIYCPICTPIPKSTTQLKADRIQFLQCFGNLTLFTAAFQRTSPLQISLAQLQHVQTTEVVGIMTLSRFTRRY